MRNDRPIPINEKYVSECQMKFGKLATQMQLEGASIAEVATAMGRMAIHLNEFIIRETDKAMQQAQSPIVEAS